ncbi:MAG: 16S rRNA (guanine(527)-N(7))-methyltransferase RsmG [Shimia sp.]
MFRTYDALIRRWTPKINLVSATTLDDLWRRHFDDSLEIADHLLPDDTDVFDLGSGGGFPALPLAIHDKSSGTDRHWTLVESDARKAAFLRTAIRELDLNAAVLHDRIERTEGRPHVLTARAYAPLPRLFRSAQHLSTPETRWLLLKGASTQAELGEAQTEWRFAHQEHRNWTHPDGVVLEVSGLVALT